MWMHDGYPSVFLLNFQNKMHKSPLHKNNCGQLFLC